MTWRSIVVGGGQAGLAIGYFLAQQGRHFAILEAAEEPAAAWRARWDSLKLFTPARYSSLPGLPFPGDPDSLSRARRRRRPISPSTRGTSPCRWCWAAASASIRRAEGRYLVELEDRSYTADQVVIATGPFQVPFVPPIADDLGQDVFQIHSTRYRAPGDLPDGPVLVVGGGNTGFQIAEELSAAPRGSPVDRVAADAAAAADSRSRPVLVSREDRCDAQVDQTRGSAGDWQGRDTLIGSNPRTLRKRHGVRSASAGGRRLRDARSASATEASWTWAP